jgi:regulator of protease activity HflC (stomatin/prohibitin superfamily)
MDVMTSSFGFFIFLLIVGGVATVVWRSTRLRARPATEGKTRRGLPGAVPVGLFAISLLTLLSSMITIVGTRDIGIVTSFGRPVTHLDNGIHFKAPWQKVSTLDGAIQTDNYTGPAECTDIRIGNESMACVDNTIRWRIKPDAGDILFRDYHSMDKIRDSLVTRELKAALNGVLHGYNPLNRIADNQAGATPDLNLFGDQVAALMRREIGSQIDVINVIIPIIRFDASTQQKLNAYQAEVANTRIAEQKEKTAIAQAQANKNLAASVSHDPNVLVSKCLDILDEMERNNRPIPPGFSCWPGSTSALVVPATGSSKPSGSTP